MMHNTVIIEPRSLFGLFRHWNVWEVSDPSLVYDCWSEAEAGKLAIAIAGDGGHVSLLEGDCLRASRNDLIPVS